MEDLALRIAALSDGRFLALTYGLFCFGGLLGAARDDASFRISRTLFIVSAIGLSASVDLTSLVFLYAEEAIAVRRFALIMGVYLMAVIANGFIFARLARSRSRDIYGHSTWGALAFIPFGVFWFAFKKGRLQSADAERSERYQLGVFWGGVLFLTCVIIRFAVRVATQGS